MTIEQYYKNLNVPTSKVDVVLDTDTYNEVDDQFAIAYLLASSDKINLKALYAAPFFNERADSPKDGMLKSYDEILRLLELTGKQEYICATFKGSEDYLPDENTPVFSDAAFDLVKRAKEYSPENPLYVIAIGAITNVASALLMNPGIAENVVVVWLGGNSREYQDNSEFNMRQDVAAARVIFKSGTPVVQLPCMGVVSGFRISVVELEHYINGKNAVCDYLLERVRDEVATYAKGTAASRVIWDVVAVAWLLNEDERFMMSRVDTLPIPEYAGQYTFDSSRHIRYVYYIERDELATDLFMKLTNGMCFKNEKHGNKY